MELHSYLQDLINIPSVNPDFAQGNPDISGEHRMTQWLAEQFRNLDPIMVTEDQVRANRNNLYVLFQGRSDKTNLWDIHMDTVGIDGMKIDPFGGVIVDGKLFGRGACDTKASFALALHILQKAFKEGKKPKHNLFLAATVGEETGGLGAKRLNRWAVEMSTSFHQALVAEPTLCAPVCAHNGLVRAKIEITGARAHTSLPQLGKNAALAAARAAVAFDLEHKRLQDPKFTKITGNPQLTVTKLAGGTGGNTVPYHCDFEYDRRVVADEDAQQIAADLLQLVCESCGPEFQVTVKDSRASQALSTDPSGDLISRFSKMSGNQPATAPYGTNALYYEPGFAEEVVVFGPGSIDQAHTDDEWIDLGELENAARIIEAWLEFA